jgi:peptidoglycan/LPS O-acetylase OafA/YrhL
MYVFHLLVVLTIGGEINGLLQATGTFRPILYSLSVILISYALGWISYHYYERHFLALKRYFVPNVTEFAPTNPANRDH